MASSTARSFATKTVSTRPCVRHSFFFLALVLLVSVLLTGRDPAAVRALFTTAADFLPSAPDMSVSSSPSFSKRQRLQQWHPQQQQPPSQQQQRKQQQQQPPLPPPNRYVPPPPDFPPRCHLIGHNPADPEPKLHNSRALCLSSAVCLRPYTGDTIGPVYVGASASGAGASCALLNPDLSVVGPRAPSQRAGENTYFASDAAAQLDCGNLRREHVMCAQGRYANDPRPQQCPPVLPLAELSAADNASARWLAPHRVAVVVPPFPWLINIYHYSFIVAHVARVISDLDSLFSAWRLPKHHPSSSSPSSPFPSANTPANYNDRYNGSNNYYDARVAAPTEHEMVAAAVPRHVTLIFRAEPPSQLGRWNHALTRILLRSYAKAAGISVDISTPEDEAHFRVSSSSSTAFSSSHSLSSSSAASPSSSSSFSSMTNFSAGAAGGNHTSAASQLRAVNDDIDISVQAFHENPRAPAGVNATSTRPVVCAHAAVLLGERRRINIWPFANGSRLSMDGDSVPAHALAVRRAVYEEYGLPVRLPPMPTSRLTATYRPTLNDDNSNGYAAVRGGEESSSSSSISNSSSGRSSGSDSRSGSTDSGSSVENINSNSERATNSAEGSSNGSSERKPGSQAKNNDGTKLGNVVARQIIVEDTSNNNNRSSRSAGGQAVRDPLAPHIGFVQSFLFDTPPLVLGYARRLTGPDPPPGGRINYQWRRFSPSDEVWFQAMLRREAAAFGVEYRELLTRPNTTVETQIRWFSGIGLVVGIHGANLVNAMFAPPFGTLLEVSPGGMRSLCYRAGGNSGLSYIYHESDKATPQESFCAPDQSCWHLRQHRRIKIGTEKQRTELTQKVREGLTRLVRLKKDHPNGLRGRLELPELRYVVDL